MDVIYRRVRKPDEVPSPQAKTSMLRASDIRKTLEKDLDAIVQRQKNGRKDLPYEDLRDWLEKDTVDADVKIIANSFQEMHVWYRGAYAASGIKSVPDATLLALSSRCAVPAFLFEIPVYDFHPQNLGYYRIDEYGFVLAQLLTTGWKDEAELVARHGFSELDRLMDRGITVRRMPWFMLELARDWLKADVSLDTSFRQEEIDNLGVWEQLLQGWREPNERTFDRLMSEMADYHLAQSRYPKNTQKDWHEFEDPACWLFPVELLAVLRLREWEGIGIPRLSHPLFSVTPLATLYPPPAWPKDEVLDAVEARFREIYPDTPSVEDLQRLRKEQGM